MPEAPIHKYGNSGGLAAKVRPARNIANVSSVTTPGGEHGLTKCHFWLCISAPDSRHGPRTDRVNDSSESRHGGKAHSLQTSIDRILEFFGLMEKSANAVTNLIVVTGGASLFMGAQAPLPVELPDWLAFIPPLSSTPPEGQLDRVTRGGEMGLRTIDLFAGVGGFHLGVDRAGMEVAWSNQWEPGKKVQHASDCYTKRFPHVPHTNVDIATVNVREIPEHDLLTGGFPCQDYSVATTQAAGLHGKKGVLWWEIHRIAKAHQPPYILLENVDRLLKSPSKQRGRDFGIILACLAKLGYAVEWRVLNAADYSAPQKRRRTFIFGAGKGTPVHAEIEANEDRRRWIQKGGLFGTAFPVVPEAVRALAPEVPDRTLPKDLQRVSDSFAFEFGNAGLMHNNQIWTSEVRPKTEPMVTLGSILQRDVDERYFVPDNLLPKWKYLKGAKAEKRKAANGHQYRYTEGQIPYPDPLNRPARTLLTSEGGVAPSRFKHLILDPQANRMRVLTPIECERLNQFPDDWTNTGMPENWRYFCMGNALVVGLVERIAKEIGSRLGPLRGETTTARRNVSIAN